MIIKGRTLTARQAAEQYVRDAFEGPRSIATWNGNRFRLLGGVKWYAVQPHAEGWQVVALEPDSEGGEQ